MLFLFLCVVVANMFSVPLGIMFHADVRFSIDSTISVLQSTDTMHTTVDHRGVHPQVCLLPSQSPSLPPRHKTDISPFSQSGLS